MIITFCIESSDNLGRLDYASLSQEALMEMLIGGITNAENICGSPLEANYVKEWKSLSWNGTDIVEIDWSSKHLEGSLSLEWMPPAVEKFATIQNNLTGSLDLTRLPKDLKELYLESNQFTGEPGSPVVSSTD